MWLSRVDVEDVRIVRGARLDPSPVINVISGGNAAGKTSLLEAVHVLGTGRSFASASVGAVVRRGAGPLRVVAHIRQAGGGDRVAGLERAASGRPRMRLDGADVARLGDLAALVPVVAIHPGSHELIAGGPGERRAYLDRGLFHVEQGFQAVWQGYRRCLEQRTALLRAGRPDDEVGAWERELGDYGERLDRLRRDYVAHLAERVERVGGRLLGEGTRLQVRYRRGWDGDTRLEEALRAGRGGDREQLRTRVGPHRGDLEVRIEDRPVRQRVSRGQQKLLAYTLRLAQAEQLAETRGCILLLDDLPAELDRVHRDTVVSVALGVGAQVFATALEPEGVGIPAEAAAKWFHVEQGFVRELVQ